MVYKLTIKEILVFFSLLLLTPHSIASQISVQPGGAELCLTTTANDVKETTATTVCNGTQLAYLELLNNISDFTPQESQNSYTSTFYNGAMIIQDNFNASSNNPFGFVSCTTTGSCWKIITNAREHPVNYVFYLGLWDGGANSGLSGLWPRYGTISSLGYTTNLPQVNKVPIPATAWLFLSGFGGIIGLARKFYRRY